MLLEHDGVKCNVKALTSLATSVSFSGQHDDLCVRMAVGYLLLGFPKGQTDLCSAHGLWAGLSEMPQFLVLNVPLSSKLRYPCCPWTTPFNCIMPLPYPARATTQAFDLGVQELHLQSWGDNVQKLSSVAFDLAGINPKQVVVKLPCTLEGIQVMHWQPS